MLLAKPILQSPTLFSPATNNSVWRRARRGTIGPHLRGRQSLGPLAKSHLNEFARLQLGNAKTPQSLHVDKYVGCAIATRQETKTTQAVDPFDLRTFDTAGRPDMIAGTHGRPRELR